MLGQRVAWAAKPKVAACRCMLGFAGSAPTYDFIDAVTIRAVTSVRFNRFSIHRKTRQHVTSHSLRQFLFTQEHKIRSLLL